MKAIKIDLVKEFTSCILESRPDDLYDLLAPDGEFNAQDAECNNTEVNRDEFIAWIKSRLAEESVTAYYYDQCTFCSIGSPVVLFNDGSFPRQIQDDSESMKTGLMLDIEGDKIKEIAFCYRFLNTENKHCFEVKADQMKALMDQGMSFEEAYGRVMGEENE
jgi:hypothetical protein